MSVSHDPGHGKLRVVVHDAHRHTAKERERRDVTVAERLRRLRGVGLDEARVAVGKVEHEVVDGPLHSSDHGLRRAEVALSMTGSMGQWHVHLTCPETPLSHVVLDYRVPAGEPMLIPQTLVDALGGVSLLPRKTAVLFHPARYWPILARCGLGWPWQLFGLCFGGVRRPSL